MKPHSITPIVFDLWFNVWKLTKIIVPTEQTKLIYYFYQIIKTKKLSRTQNRESKDNTLFSFRKPRARVPPESQNL